MIRRAELYLNGGYPIKTPYTRNLDKLQDFRRIRNQIAHKSKESLTEYRKVLRKHYGTIPLIIPQPGEFLLETDRTNPAKYILLTYFDDLKKLADDLT